MRLVVVSIVAGALLAPTASASVVPLPPPVEVRDEPCPSDETALACALPGIVYMSPTLSPGREWNRVWWHELGHEVDYTLLTEEDRATFERLIGSSLPWSDEADDEYLPGEQFADAYMMCRLPRAAERVRERRRGGVSIGTVEAVGSATGYNPSPRTYRRVCRWLESLSP